MKFTHWLLQREMLSPVLFPPAPPDRNPYINGKWSTTAFPTGKAKVKNNPEQERKRERKNDTKQDGFHL